MLHIFLALNKILEMGPCELMERLFLTVWGHSSPGVDMQCMVPGRFPAEALSICFQPFL